ncbi:zinc transporter 4 [Platysternon megacephalum]|uniref:Arginine/serine-rich protein 1 n=1 Tax=Platysternon megacephalum TaxID=55544 RepID=A0A4D9ES70_9SAUR|nr:zinc transporter 4 [Platysternon megacephalum]
MRREKQFGFPALGVGRRLLCWSGDLSTPAMAVTHETGLSPQAPPQAQDPCGGDQATWSQSPQVVPHGSQEQRSPAAPSGTETGCSRTSVKTDTISKGTVTEKLQANKKTEDMTNYMDDLTLSSPKERDSRSKSKTSRGRSSSRSSCSSRSSSSTSSTSSRSWSRPRSRSRSQARRNGSRRYRRYSRSYSRSRSRSRSLQYRGRYHPRTYRRYRRSPPRYRSHSRSRSRGRSWSRGRSYYRRCFSRSRSRSRGRRYYGFGRTIYPEAYRSWRSRSQTRSHSRTSLRLSEKDRRELLEIAKANAAKALGTDNIVLPASLRVYSLSKETNGGKCRSEDSAESTEVIINWSNLDLKVNFFSKLHY